MESLPAACVLDECLYEAYECESQGYVSDD